MLNKLNGISFKGAYVLKSPTKKDRQDFEKAAITKVNVFEDFEKKGDVLYVTKPQADSRINAFLLNSNIKFDYYPQYSTKDNFNPNNPERAKLKIAEAKGNTLSKFDIQQKGTLSEKEHAKIIAKALDLNAKKFKFPKSGIKYLIGENNKTLALISPKSDQGISFVVIYPQNNDDSTRYLAVDNFGNIAEEYKSLNSIKKFREKFNSIKAIAE